MAGGRRLVSLFLSAVLRISPMGHVPHRFWCNDLQTHINVRADESGIGRGEPIWFNEMRLHCIEGDGHAGFWRYAVGEFSVLLFHVIEIDRYTCIVQYDRDQHSLPCDPMFHESHVGALTAAQTQIRQDGRGKRTSMGDRPLSGGRFPSPYDVFPDAVRVTRVNLNPARTLLNTDPFDLVVHAGDAVRHVYDAVLELERVPDGIWSSGPDFGVEYQLTFYQNGLPVGRVCARTNRPQFLYDENARADRCYLATERFWSELSRLLQLSREEIFPSRGLPDRLGTVT